MPLPLVLIHGYSDKGASFKVWREKLTTGQSPLPLGTTSTCSYESLTDEVTIKDLADGLDRALTAKLGNGNTKFDAIVHSTGMLVNNKRLFAPFSTTLVEIRLDRDALPLDLSKISKLLQWD